MRRPLPAARLDDVAQSPMGMREREDRLPQPLALLESCLETLTALTLHLLKVRRGALGERGRRRLPAHILARRRALRRRCGRRHRRRVCYPLRRLGPVVVALSGGIVEALVRRRVLAARWRRQHQLVVPRERRRAHGAHEAVRR